MNLTDIPWEEAPQDIRVEWCGKTLPFPCLIVLEW